MESRKEERLELRFYIKFADNLVGDVKARGPTGQ